MTTCESTNKVEETIWPKSHSSSISTKADNKLYKAFFYSRGSSSRLNAIFRKKYYFSPEIPIRNISFLNASVTVQRIFFLIFRLKSRKGGSFSYILHRAGHNRTLF